MPSLLKVRFFLQLVLDMNSVFFELIHELTFWPLQLSCSAGLGCCWNSQEGHHHFQNQGHKSLRYVRLSRHRTMGSFRLLHCKLISPVGQDLKFLWTHCCWQILYRVIVPSTRGINIVINWVKSYLTLKCPSPKILYFLIWNYTLLKELLRKNFAISTKRDFLTNFWSPHFCSTPAPLITQTSRLLSIKSCVP